MILHIEMVDIICELESLGLTRLDSNQLLNNLYLFANVVGLMRKIDIALGARIEPTSLAA